MNTRLIVVLLLLIVSISARSSENSSISGWSKLDPCGVWKWAGSVNAIIKNDRTTSNGANKGNWRWTDESKRQFKIEWKNGYTDKLTISPDGETLYVVNNLRVKFVAHRISSGDKDSSKYH